MKRFRKIVGEVSSFVYSSKNSNNIKMAAAAVVDALSTAINVVGPVVIADHFQNKSDNDDSMDYLPFAAGSALFVAQILPNIRNMLLSSVRANVQKELALGMVDKAFALELDHQLTEKTSDFALALSKNYSSVDQGIPALFGTIFPTMLEALSTSTFLITRYGAVGGLQMATLLLYLIVAGPLEEYSEDLRNQSVMGSFQAYGVIVSAIANYFPAHLFGNVAHELEKVDESLIHSEKLFSATHRKADRNALILSILNSIGFVGTLAYAALLPAEGEFKLIPFMLIVYFMTRFNTLLNALAPAITTFYTAMADAEKVVDYLLKESKVVDAENAMSLSMIAPPMIEFKNVTFSYGDNLILDNVSFRVKAREKVGIVGPTGAGKSTILNLLLKFYKPDSGQIFVNGVDVAEVTAASLRDHMAVVAQSTTLSDDSVTQNIRYGDLSATDDDVREAARVAQLIREDGDIAILGKSVGQGGGKLSGGERQRTTIARALLFGGGAPAFLLDEPTSALDLETERDVQRSLDDLTKDSTTILVTHRLNTVMNANRILYLKDGRILESGSFQELMQNTQGFFYNQFNVQCQELGIEPDQLIRFEQQDATSYDSSELKEAGSERGARNGFLSNSMKGNFWDRRRQRQRAEVVEVMPDEEFSSLQDETMRMGLLKGNL